MKRAKQPTPEPTTVPIGALRRQAHGGALRNGGTNRGGPGRPPDEFKQLLSSLASRDATVKALGDILQDKDHPHYMKALAFASDRGYPELASAVRAAQVNVINVSDGKHIWRFGDRVIEFD